MEEQINPIIIRALSVGTIYILDPHGPIKEGHVESVNRAGVYADTLPLSAPAEEMPIEATVVFYSLGSYGKTWALSEDELI
jgi:hypothetical protein